MELLESVLADEVPTLANPVRGKGLWTDLARRAVADYAEGKVSVVRVKDQQEYRRMRNGMSQAFRDAGFQCMPRTIEEADGLRVYLELRAKEERNVQPRRPAANGIRPRIRKLPAGTSL